MHSEISNSFESLYNETVQSSDLSAISRGTANALIEHLLTTQNDPHAANLTQQIQEAAAKGDTDMIFRLTDELRQAKATQSQRGTELVRIAREYTLMDVLRAFPAFREMIYEMGLLVLQKTEEGVKAKKPRTSGTSARSRRNSEHPQGTIFLISRNGKTLAAQKNNGAPKHPIHEREFFEFLGFEISGDGRSLVPPTFTNKGGQLVTASSKKVVIEDMLAGGKFWADKGYKIAVKPPEPATSPA